MGKIRKMSASAAQRLLDAPGDETLQGLRDRAMLALMANGLRVSEIARLDIGDIDVDTGLLRARSRLFTLDDKAQRALRKWLAARRLLGMDDPAVFIALRRSPGRQRSGRRIDERAIRYVVDRYLKIVGEKRAQISCDALRVLAQNV